MDARSARLASLGEQVLAPGVPSTGHWAPDLEEMPQVGVGELLVVFALQRRGAGLGPALIGSATRRLSGGCAVGRRPALACAEKRADRRPPVRLRPARRIVLPPGLRAFPPGVLIVDLSPQKAGDLLPSELEKTAALGE
jgi:hypothetical protein